MFLFGGISINKLIIEWIDVKTKKSKANYAVTITVDLTKADKTKLAQIFLPIDFSKIKA
jgi:hypothetical protein